MRDTRTLHHSLIRGARRREVELGARCGLPRRRNCMLPKMPNAAGDARAGAAEAGVPLQVKENAARQYGPPHDPARPPYKDQEPPAREGFLHISPSPVFAGANAFGECSSVALLGTASLLDLLPATPTPLPGFAAGSLGQWLLVPGTWTPGPVHVGTPGPVGGAQGPCWVSHSTSRQMAPWWRGGSYIGNGGFRQVLDILQGGPCESVRERTKLLHRP
ncbi:hypothetical protein NDU88_005505 [Pleurodeles waltl]|uniref:Uncharacterized protein n=1 Tax=Pleurodeles waltl TaxID=8319 RepID=A0AAV7TUY6_PLEWA|nr:hypothetical protein NDU88_005505 [Pleurodeles waltl]